MRGLEGFEKTFLGVCFGVGLKRRSLNDRHVTFALLVEDDGNWFVSKYGGGSSFWMSEVIDEFNEAYGWMVKNCDLDASGFGWVFR